MVTDNSDSGKISCNTTTEWDSSLDSHPAFATVIDPCSGLHPATEALQALKFESEDQNGQKL